MCSHIHVVAGKQGNPGPEWLDENLTEDTVGMQECLRRLHRLNYRERMVTLQPLIDEFIDLLKVKSTTIECIYIHIYYLSRKFYRWRFVAQYRVYLMIIFRFQSDHNVDLDQLENVLRSGLEVMRSSKPAIQATRDDESHSAKPFEVKKMRKCCRKGDADFEEIISPGKVCHTHEYRPMKFPN